MVECDLCGRDCLDWEISTVYWHNNRYLLCCVACYNNLDSMGVYDILEKFLRDCNGLWDSA